MSKVARKVEQGKYHVSARVFIDAGIEIVADSLEDAVVKSKSLTFDNFVDVLGDLNDHKMRVTSVFEDYKEVEL